MSGSGWSIRLFEANEYDDEFTIDHMSNFKKGKSRQLDTVRTYSGMYGIDNYLVWNIHKNLPNYDFSTMALDLNLFMYKSTDIPYFQDFYRVQDVRYNPNNSQYTLYAISETTIKLHTKLINYDITSLSYKENRTAKELLMETIEAKNIFYLRFHDDTLSTKDMIHYQYRYFDIDPEWTVLDLIEYIADDNKYEWCVTTFVDKETNIPSFFLHIGHELKADKYMNATKKFNIEDDNISDSVYTKKITTNGSPMQPLASWEGNLRCLWSKHSAGRGGGISKGCFAPVGMGHFDKILYLRTLEGEIEKNIGHAMLSNPPHRKNRIPSVSIGNILKDEGILKEGETIKGISPYIDEISIQKNPQTYSITEPHNIIINRGDDLAVQHQLERATRSTSYLDDEAGLLFPSPKLENPPPNSLIFNVDGKRESAVIGPYVYGDGRIERDEEGKPTGERTLKIPFKDKKEDFRLRFPDGAEIYYDSDRQIWFVQSSKGWAYKQAITDYDKKPEKTRLTESENMFQIYEGNVMWDSQTLHMHLMDGGCFQVVPKTGPQPSDPYRRFALYCDNETGEIILEAKNDIEIVIKYQGALDTGTITINTTGIVNIGANASAVNIAGGANVLSHGTHTHQTGNMGVPIPPHSPADGTIKTKAD